MTPKSDLGIQRMCLTFKSLAHTQLLAQIPQYRDQQATDKAARQRVCPFSTGKWDSLLFPKSSLLGVRRNPLLEAGIVGL